MVTFVIFFYNLGKCTSRNAWGVIFIGYFIAFLLTACIVEFGDVEDNIENLWIKEGGRVYNEFQYVKDYAIEGVARDFILIDSTEDESLAGEDMLAKEKLIAMGDFIQDTFLPLKGVVKDIAGVEHEFETKMVLDGGSTGAYNRLTALDCFVEGEYDYDTSAGFPNVEPLHTEFNDLVDDSLFDSDFDVTPYNWCMFAKIYPIFDLLMNEDHEAAIQPVADGWSPISEGACKRVSRDPRLLVSLIFFC